MKRIFLSLLLPLFALAPAAAQTSSQGATAIPGRAIWGKLVISGNIVTCYYGTGTTSPTTCIELGSPQTIGFINDPLLVGICITSHNVAAISSGTIDNFSITPAPAYRLTDADIGAPG
jgi:hypothetical protein